MSAWLCRVALIGAALAGLLSATAVWAGDETEPRDAQAVGETPSRETPSNVVTAPTRERRLILAVKDSGEPLSGAGGSPRGDYRRMAGYAGSARAVALAETLAREYELRERSAWTIAPLNLRCMLYAIGPEQDLDTVIQKLQHDDRVQLVEPLQEFETLGGATLRVDPSNAAPPDATAAYNDPYYGLQRGFQQMSVAALQQLSQGTGVKVAVIDTGVDARHPDLLGRLPRQRDYVSGGGNYVDTLPERHGTEVLGLIAARVNNRTGIAGLAPGAVLLSYRACWSEAAHAGEPGNATARCNSYTLAQALGAAIADGADVINLSLGGPNDPLLTRLAVHAQSHGAVVVAAAPPERLGPGFPNNVPGALVVGAAGEPQAGENWLAAPGRSVLTTVPGGEYDMSSGSSLAAANAAGVVALLRSLVPSADADRLRQALRSSMTSASSAINACQAARLLGARGLRCP